MIMELLHDSGIWLLCSFVIFMFILMRAGKAAFIAMLDGRIERIREEIATAENLRIEAQEMLAQYQRKHRDAVKEAELIVLEAQKRADAMTKEAEKELAEMVARREKQLKDRLARLEQSAVAEIQKYAADLAIKATREIISEELDKKGNEKLVDDSIKSLAQNLN